MSAAERVETMLLDCGFLSFSYRSPGRSVYIWPCVVSAICWPWPSVRKSALPFAIPLVCIRIAGHKMATEVWLCALHNSLSFSLANDAIIYSRFDIVLAATREPPRFIFYYFSSVSLSLTICHLHSISGPASRAAAPLLEIKRKRRKKIVHFLPP